MAEEERERLGITPQMRRCIDATSECYTVCTETLSYSLNNGQLTDERHLRLLIDACEILQTTENTLLRNSELGTMLAAVCMEACEKVSQHCSELNNGDAQLAACIESCNHTANCCSKLAI